MMLRLFPKSLLLVLLLSASANADTHRWRPQATAVVQRSTLTFAGTYSSADTVTTTIGNSPLAVTVGTDASTTAIADDVAEAINASDTTSDLGSAYQRSAGGQTIPEFSEVRAVASGSVVTIYVKTPGKPVAIAVSEDAAAGTAVAATAEAATGPNHFDNAANWTGGEVPASGDSIIFDSGNVDCKYALDDLRSNTKICGIRATTDYTGTIGLDYRNTDAQSSKYHYIEYRDRYMQGYDPNDASPTDLVIQKGLNGGAGGRYLFDLQGQDYDDVTIRDCGSGSVEIHGGSVASLYIGRGNVTIDPDAAGQSAGMTPDAVTIGASTGASSTVRFGSLTTWATAGTAVAIYSGTVTFDCPLDTGTPAATVTQHGGAVELRSDGDLDAYTIRDGTFDWTGSGTANQIIYVWGDGVLNLGADNRTKAFNGVTAFRNATIHQGGHSPTITFTGCLRQHCTITE